MAMTATQTRAVYFSSETDNWATPIDFYNRLDDEFEFILDVCSSTENRKAATFYALDHPDEDRRDGLTRPWAEDSLLAMLTGQHGDRHSIYCNPPYGRGIRSWMAKARQAASEGATVVCVVPVRSCTRWWHEEVLDAGAEIRYVKGRLTFGAATTPAPFASAVVIYRPTDEAGTPGRTAVMTAKAAA